MAGKPWKGWNVKAALLLGLIALVSTFLSMWLDALWIRWVGSW